MERARSALRLSLELPEESSAAASSSALVVALDEDLWVCDEEIDLPEFKKRRTPKYERLAPSESKKAMKARAIKGWVP